MILLILGCNEDGGTCFFYQMGHWGKHFSFFVFKGVLECAVGVSLSLMGITTVYHGNIAHKLYILAITMVICQYVE